ncbi:MAG: DUF6084 family protein [Ginsengibacter sp.]
MPDLKFEIISSHVKQYAAIPTLVFNLQITNDAENEEVYAAALKCQIIIEAVKRRYNEETKDRLYELFGDAARWHETLRTTFWQIVTVPVPRFIGKAVVEINVPCSEDQGLAAGKYFYAVRDDTVPLAFLFSGTLFYKDPEGNLQITLVPWEKEAFCKMPAALWQEMMDTHYPNSRWLQIRKDIYERLVRYKALNKFHTLEECLESILDEALKETEKQMHEQ